jgi:LmbE family N-acetylglucosaminyl deacetylase
VLALPLPLPVDRPLRVLCLGAHSDDIEIGCGGTVLALRAAQPATDFRWVVWSAAGARAAEARASAKRFLGQAYRRQLALHRFRDGFFPAEFAAIKDAFEETARGFDPDIVLTHYRDDRHQDHRIVSDLTWNTFRRQLILESEIPKWDGDLGQPNWYLPLSARLARRKVSLLMEGFASQRGKDWFRPDTFRGLMRLRGNECRAESGFAEAFYLRKGVMSVGRLA